MPEPPLELQRASEAARAWLGRELAKLSPDEVRQKTDEIARAIGKAFEMGHVPEDRFKDLLRRLGCQADLDNPAEYWRQLWAYAHDAGFPDAEFWETEPRDLFAVLEIKAAEIERAHGRGLRARKRRAKTPGRQETDTERAARRQAALMPILKDKGWKVGRLVTKSAVGKATVYGYFDGSRKTISHPNRKAIADTLGIELRKLPN